MPSSNETLEFIMEKIADAGDVSFRKMMGEYVIYLDAKVVGGIYDNRFLVKKTPSAINLLKDFEEEIPYPGAKKMSSLSDLVFNADSHDIALIVKILKAIRSDL